MSLLFSATASNRADLAADGGRDVTRGALLTWVYITTTHVGRLAVLVDPVNLRSVQDFGIISAGANLAMLHDFVTTDLNATAAFANFSAYGLNKWLRIACVWDHGGGATAQKLYVGDESTGLAEPSAYVTQQDGAGGWQARDASSFWKLGNRRQNDANLKGRMSDILLVDRSSGANPTAAEMDAWFLAPGRFAGAVWGFELGVGGSGLTVRNLYGTAAYTGTVTGATVDAHRAAKSYLRRGVVHLGRGLAAIRAPSVATLSAPLQLTTSTLVLSATRANAGAAGVVGTLQVGSDITLSGVRAAVAAAPLVGALDVSGGVALTASLGAVAVAGRTASLDVSGGVALTASRAAASSAGVVGTLSVGSTIALSGTPASVTAAAPAGALLLGSLSVAGVTAVVSAAGRSGSILFGVTYPTEYRLRAGTGPRYRVRATRALRSRLMTYDYVIDCSQDFVPDVLVDEKVGSTGRYGAAAGITGITLHLAATQGGAQIHASLGGKVSAERPGVPGSIYPTTAFEVADLQANLLPTYRGQIVFLVLSKSGDIIGKSMRCLVTPNGV